VTTTTRTRVEPSWRRRALVVAVLGIVLALVAWQVDAFDFLMYPLRLFVTFVHESGHGLAALATGGEFRQMVVNSNGSGLAYTAGGNRAVILVMGYLGAALFGAGLFYIANRVPRPRAVAAGLGVLVAAMSVLYTGFLSTAFLVGLGFGAVLLLLAWKAPANIALLVLNFLAVITGLNAVFDLVALVNTPDAMMGPVRNDAAAFSAEITPLVPGYVWAVVWAALAIALLAAALYYGVIRRIR
jgi:hypothetical protein